MILKKKDKDFIRNFRLGKEFRYSSSFVIYKIEDVRRHKKGIYGIVASCKHKKILHIIL